MAAGLRTASQRMTFRQPTTVGCRLQASAFCRGTETSTVKVTVRYEALNARNESTSKTLDIDSGELALMIGTDRHERARQAQKPVEDIEPRHPRRILDEL